MQWSREAPRQTRNPESSWVSREGGLPEWHPTTPQQMPQNSRGPKQLSDASLQFSSAPALPSPEPGCFLFRGPQSHGSVCLSGLCNQRYGRSAAYTHLWNRHTRSRESFTRLPCRPSLTRRGRSTHDPSSKERLKMPCTDPSCQGKQLRGGDTPVMRISIWYL